MNGKNKVDNLIPTTYGAVILAAGYSSRMNAFKPLLPVGDMTAIERSLAVVKDSGISEAVVVTGHNRELIIPSIERASTKDRDDRHMSVIEAYNENFADGMFSSVKKGILSIREKAPGIKGVFLMPVDCPLISSFVLTELMQRAEDDDFCVPVFEGKKGHPLFIPKKYFDEICEYDGPGGLKAITDKYWEHMKRIPVDEEGCLMDMDTPEGYEEIKAFLRAGCKREPLHELAVGRKICLIRHGQTRQHAEKMFIGRYDVPLAEGAEDSVKKMTSLIIEELKTKAFSPGGTETPKKIYVSSLKRALQTAEIIKTFWETSDAEKDGLTGNNIELCTEEDFQEISLGEWDGKTVREVKEKYPEEYARRGRDMFAFKTGNKAENFYDVQYRSVKTMRKILEGDKSQVIVIVAHSAVIRALENNLKGLKIDDMWQPMDKCQYRIIEL